VNGEVGAPSLMGTATRRRRALAHLSPIFDLHLYRARNPSEVAWAAYDLIALVQLTVDAVAVSSGLDGNLGTPRTVVLAEMVRAAAAMAPDRPGEEHQHVAVHVLDHLLRHDQPTPYFDVEYADPADGWKTRTRQVRVLYETLAADGESLQVNVDNAAVALLLIATNRSLEDEHEAVIAVMRAQAESGRLDAAIQSAEDAVTLSRTYAANVRRMLGEAERDVTRVDYVNVLRPELSAATAHLERRINIDGSFLRHLENLRADASEEQDPAAVRQLSVATSRLGEAVGTLAELQTDVIGAAPRWRDAQAAQAFTAAPVGAVDPTVDMLSALLRGGPLPPGADLSPARGGRLLDVVGMADRLVEPRRPSVEELGAPVSEEPLGDVDGVYEQFPEHFHDTALVIRSRRVAPGSKARLSELLADVDALFARADAELVTGLAGLAGSREVARRRLRLLLALEAMMLWRPAGRADDGDDWWAVDDGTRRSLPDLDLPDLLVHRRGGHDDHSRGRT
jgi:hypothetical protein